jgi:hypothetical protein
MDMAGPTPCGPQVGSKGNQYAEFRPSPSSELQVGPPHTEGGKGGAMWGPDWMSDDKSKPVEIPVSIYSHSRVRDDMDDATWHRSRDEEERDRKSGKFSGFSDPVILNDVV